MSKENMWGVVHFIDDETIATIPKNWIFSKENGLYCAYWPPKGVNTTLSVKRQVEPSSNWGKYDIKILGLYGKILLFSCT